MKKKTIIGTNTGTKTSLETALNKVRIVRGYTNNNGLIYGIVTLPPIMVGRKIKVILVEE